MFASNIIHFSRRGLGVLMTLSLLFTPLLSTANASVRAAPAYTEVGGPIISDTTWTLANSPYIVVANVEVWQGVTLIIQPGVVVKFNKNKVLQVNGTLVARGAAANLITFTSNQVSPAKGDWKNIKFTDHSVDATFDGAGNYTGGSIKEYCVVEYGGNGVNGAIQTDQASPLVDHCTVRDSSSSGIWAVGGSTLIVIRNNIINDNSARLGKAGGIYAKVGTITGNTVSGNSASGDRGDSNADGIYAENSTVTGNAVSGNLADSDDCSGGIYATYSEVTDNIVSNNSGSDSFDGDNLSSNGGIHAYESTVRGNVVSGNSADGYFARGGGIYAGGGTVTGNTVRGNSTTGYRHSHGGGINAENSTVTSNTISNNSANNGGGIYAYHSLVTGNTVIGNSASNEGGGIYASGMYAYHSQVISNTVTANSLSTASGQGSGVYSNDSGDLLHNTIVGNTTPTGTIGGVAIDGTPQFHHNNLYGNSNYDVVILSSQNISGTDNYWGTAATVDILAHVYDWYDDSTRGRLLYIPYSQDPDPNAPVPPPQNLRANFAGGSTSLSWDAIPSTTTGYRYKVYYDTDASGPPYHGAGATEGDSPIDVGNATHFTLSGLGSGVHVAVTAYDTQGRESWYSNEGSSPRRIYLPAVLKR